MLFIEYPKCTTCQKAKKFLQDRGLVFEDRHIKENRPTEAELRSWQSSSGLPLKKFFNTSGLLYKELHLSEKLNGMSEDEQFKLLASDGMLVKRPILIGENFITTGFNEKVWIKLLTKQ